MIDSVFIKMLKGDHPCQKLYEDDLTFVILDQNPLTHGHALVIPKQQIDHLDDCSPELYAAVFATVQRMSVLLRDKLSPLRVALVVHGFEVAHAHVHIIPLYTGKELRLAAVERSHPSEAELDAQAEILIA